MRNILSFENRKHKLRALILFTIFSAAHPCAALILLRYCFPEIVGGEFQSGWPALVLTMFGSLFVFCFGEYFFHRYILHTTTLKFLRNLTKKHILHHSLTAIRCDQAGGAMCRIRSAYPIVNEAQDASSTFPMWSLSAFLGTFTPLFLLLAWRFPGFPIFPGGYAALTISYYSYEVLHMIHHEPYEDWARKISWPVTGGIWRRLYGFHQAHHANADCNMGIGGFLGLPIADWVFGTYKQPRILLADHSEVSKETVRSLAPSPRWPISWLDRHAALRERRILSHS